MTLYDEEVQELVATLEGLARVNQPFGALRGDAVNAVQSFALRVHARASASPGAAETVEQRVIDLEKMLKRVTSWLEEMIKDRATLGHPLSASGSLAMAVQDAHALLAASSGKTGERDEVEAVLADVEEAARYRKELGAPCDDFDTVASWLTLALAGRYLQGKRPAPVSQGPEREEPRCGCCGGSGFVAAGMLSEEPCPFCSAPAPSPASTPEPEKGGRS